MQNRLSIPWFAVLIAACLAFTAGCKKSDDEKDQTAAEVAGDTLTGDTAADTTVGPPKDQVSAETTDVPLAENVRVPEDAVEEITDTVVNPPDEKGEDNAVPPDAPVEEETSQPDLPAEDSGPEDVVVPDAEEDTTTPQDVGPFSDLQNAGACTNDADQAVLDDDTLENSMQGCITQCIGKPVTCLTNCIVDETGLSEECAACFAESVACAMEHCADVCIGNPGSPECKQCRLENCGPALQECSCLWMQ